jgi:hypothetical protein
VTGVQTCALPIFDSFAKRKSQNGFHQYPLPFEPGGGAVARLGKKLGHDHRQFYHLGVGEIRSAGNAKKMDQIAALPVIPPSHEFNLDSRTLQSRSGLFNLSLLSAVGEGERQAGVNEDFHLENGIAVAAGL